MIAVIVAGGSGTRLWPLSTPEYPKHLLNVIDDTSLLQNAYSRAKRLSDKIYVITEISHAHHVKEQLPDLPNSAFVIEPARRNTSGCMLAALHHVQGLHDHDEAMAILWADHCIRDAEGFAQSFKIAGRASEKHGRVTLVGIEPTYPSTGFGYIHKAAAVAEDEFVIYNVEGFKEKPELETAQKFFQSGEYLWNGGYLVGTVNAFTKAMETYCPQLWNDYQSLVATSNDDEYKNVYLGFESIALDYRFNELVKDLLVVPAAFDWMDLGSFGDLHKAVISDKQGNYAKGNCVELEEVESSYIYNQDNKPVVVIGMDNVVVVNTKDGLLVARKDIAQKVGEVSKRIQKKEK